MRKISTNTYLDTEETLERSELWRGFVVRDAASPVFAHQIATTRLTVLLDRAARDARAGVVCVSPIDVVLDRDKAIVLQPDIVFVSSARRTIIRDRVEGAPDLVVEVISASTARILASTPASSPPVGAAASASSERSAASAVIRSKTASCSSSRLGKLS